MPEQYKNIVVPRPVTENTQEKFLGGVSSPVPANSQMTTCITINNSNADCTIEELHLEYLSGLENCPAKFLWVDGGNVLFFHGEFTLSTIGNQRGNQSKTIVFLPRRQIWTMGTEIVLQVKINTQAITQGDITALFRTLTV